MPTFKEGIAACEARAIQLGYAFDKFILLETGITPRRLTKILDARGIQDLLKLGPFIRGAIPHEFDVIWKRSATIVLGARPVQPALSAVMNDQFSTVGQATEEVARLGYQRAGLCINSKIEDIVEHRFLGGFLAAHGAVCRLPGLGERLSGAGEQLPECRERLSGLGEGLSGLRKQLSEARKPCFLGSG